MAINKELLDILCCPETKEPVSLAGQAEVGRVNEAIKAGKVKRRSGEAVSEAIDGGLLRADGKYLYPVQDDIPIMLIDEAIDMATVS
jgi:uncharacterized protein YbaR (Trm112 family)